MMISRTSIRPAIAIAVLTAIIVGVSIVLLRSTETSDVESQRGYPTSTAGKSAKTINDALNVSREFFTASPPFLVHEIESVSYVESSVGEARTLFDPDRVLELWGAADDWPAWVVVASGQFQRGTLRADGTRGTGGWERTVWVVVPMDEIGAYSGIRNEEYDLSQLGAVKEVPVPLAEFPNPIELE